MLALAPISVPATVAPSPAPQPTLKIIVRTRSSSFCTALRERIAPAIAGLLTNDKVIAQAKPAFFKMSHDFVGDPQGPAMQMDEMQFRSVVAALEQNLTKIDGLLSDPRLSAAQETAEDAALAQMRAQLQAVAQQQRATLDLLSGSAATTDYWDIKTHPVGLDGALGKEIDDTQGSKGTNGGFYQPIDVGGGSNVVSDPVLQLSASDLANNPYARYIVAVLDDEQKIGVLEDAAAKSVLANAPSCGSPR